MRFIPLVVSLLILALPAVAVTITERPDTIGNGQPIYITIRNLPEDSTFSLLVESTSAVQPDSEFVFQMSQFVMPFALKKSSVTATLSGTSQNKLEVMKESTIVTVSGKSVDGHFSTTKTYDITQGTYDYFRLSGTSLPSSTSITAQIQVTGTKQGPDDSEISFVVEGLTTGFITTAVLVDGHQVMYKTIPVGGTPGPGGSSTSYSGPSTSATAPPPEQWNTFTSADGLASITVSQAGTVGFLKVPAEHVTQEMRVISGPYSLVPQNATYLPPAKLQFQIPEGTHLGGLAIASLSGETWTLLSSKIQNDTMSATITSSGTYALFGPVVTPATTLTTVTTMTTLPITTAPTTPPTTKTSLSPVTLVLALGIGCIVLLVKKR